MRSERYDTVNGIRLHSYCAGDPAAEAIVFLHGFPEWGGAWEAQLSWFGSQGYYAVAPDQRGYNRSDKPGGIRSYTVDRLSADIAALIEILGSGPVTLVGHDWGGAVAWELAARRPDLLRRLVVLNMPHPAAMRAALKQDPGQVRRSWYAGFFQLPLLPEICCRAFDFALLKRTLRRSARPGTFSAADLARYAEAWAQPGALRAMLNWYRAFRYNRTQRTLVETPALLLWGRRDAFLKDTLPVASLRYCTNASLHWFDEATHWLQHEEADAVNTLIAGWLTKDRRGHPTGS